MAGIPPFRACIIFFLPILVKILSYIVDILVNKVEKGIIPGICKSTEGTRGTRYRRLLVVAEVTLVRAVSIL